MQMTKINPLDRLAIHTKAAEMQSELLGDFNTFIESMMLDQSGEKISQGEIHRSWYEHIVDCQRRGMYAGLLCPWGHGKSFQMAVAYPAYRLALDTNIRIKVISASDEIARDRVSVIKSMIEREDSLYAESFAHVRPDNNRSWTGSKIYLKRAGTSTDPSLEAISILSSRMGARADLIIFDDVVDLQNGVQKPVMREKVKEAFRSGWLSRLEPNGQVVYIGTVWHEDDLSMELLDNKQFSFLVQSVSPELDAIECRYTNKGNDE